MILRKITHEDIEFLIQKRIEQIKLNKKSFTKEDEINLRILLEKSFNRLLHSQNQLIIFLNILIDNKPD